MTKQTSVANYVCQCPNAMQPVVLAVIFGALFFTPIMRCCSPVTISKIQNIFYKSVCFCRLNFNCYITLRHVSVIHGLTYCGTVMSYDDRRLGKHWIMCYLGKIQETPLNIGVLVCDRGRYTSLSHSWKGVLTYVLSFHNCVVGIMKYILFSYWIILLQEPHVH